MDAKKHSQALGGAKVTMSKKIGGKFQVFDNYIRGKNLFLVPGKQIVQTWRGSNWKKTEMDSIFHVTFEKAKGGTRLTLVHSNIPEREMAGIRDGWRRYYWAPFRENLGI